MHGFRADRMHLYVIRVRNGFLVADIPAKIVEYICDSLRVSGTDPRGGFAAVGADANYEPRERLECGPNQPCTDGSVLRPQRR
jgi:hypothetical protein